MLADHRYFVSEKEVVCNEIYDLTGIVPEQEIEYRESKYKGKSFPKDILLGDIEGSAYNLPFRSK